MQDAESCLFALNSAAETGKDAVDTLRSQGYRVGILSPNMLRPFPAEAIRKAMRNVKAAISPMLWKRKSSGGGSA